jgi:hypothetical protein
MVAMSHRICFVVVLTGFLLGGWSATVEAHDPPGFWERLKKRVDLDPRTGFFGYHEWKHKPLGTNWERLGRAGCPHLIAPWAACQDDWHYDGYYVGGGAAWGDRDQRNYVTEGTWGWDYAPPWSIVKLDWFHWRRHQAGEGQYNPDSNNNPFDDFTNP